MQFLFEEFFGKAFKFINSTNIFMRTLFKIIFYLVILGLIVFAIWLIMTGKVLIVIIILGLYLLSELAHYIRKSREKVMQKNITEINATKKQPKNKDLLKPKNKDLLKETDKKLSVTKKPIAKSRKSKTIDKQLLKNKVIGKSTRGESIDLKKSKNINLLNKKPKNKTLLKKI